MDKKQQESSGSKSKSYDAEGPTDGFNALATSDFCSKKRRNFPVNVPLVGGGLR